MLSARVGKRVGHRAWDRPSGVGTRRVARVAQLAYDERNEAFAFALFRSDAGQRRL
jgi:hypothetical protein